MKYLAVFAFLFFTTYASPLFGYDTLFYRVAVPNKEAKGSYYILYSPKGSCDSIKKMDGAINITACTPVLLSYAERTVVFDADSFTIEMDRTTALYFKAKNGKRDLFLNHYVNTNKCWMPNAVLYAMPQEKNTDMLSIYLANAAGDVIKKDNETLTCGGEVLAVNVDELYANATGRQPSSVLRNVRPKISVEQANKVLIIRVPQEAYATLVSLNFELYNSSKRQVKEMLNLRATENVLYINDLPKGKYKYKLWVYDGTLLKEGEVTIKK